MANWCTKFEDFSFSRSTNILGTKIYNGSRDHNHAFLG